MTRQLDILVADSSAESRNLLSLFVKAIGHRVRIASSGAEAVDQCRQSMPGLVLLDTTLPVMDGYRAAREIRQLAGERWVPVIFLSHRFSQMDQIHGLEVGDDYLQKPINPRLLEAKIKVMARIADMQQKVSETTVELEAYRRASEAEQHFAHELFDHIIGYRNSHNGRVKCWIKPAAHLSGDVIAHAYTPQGTLHLMVADSTGHGLAAAICILPGVSVFSSMTRKGHDIGSIAREINHKLHHVLPVGRFVAGALVSVDFPAQEIRIWNGGCPGIVFASDSGEVSKIWPSAQPPFGVLDDARFDGRMEVWRWPEPGQLIVCSDGIVEAENAAGEFFGIPRLLGVLKEIGGQDAFAAVIHSVLEHLGDQETRDDVSLAAITCDQPA